MHQVETLDDGRVRVVAYIKDKNGMHHTFSVFFNDMDSYIAIMQAEEEGENEPN